MYLTPRMLFEKFLVEEQIARVDEFGRVTSEFKPAGELFGCMSSCNPQEIEKWHALKHEVSHKIVTRWGKFDVKVGDKLIRNDEVYLVAAVNDIGGQFKIWYVTRRSDLK